MQVLVTLSYLSKLAQHALLQIVDRRNLRTPLQPCGFWVLLSKYVLTRLSLPRIAEISSPVISELFP